MKIVINKVKVATLMAEMLVLATLMGCRTQLIMDQEAHQEVIAAMEESYAVELLAAQTLVQDGDMTPEERMVCWPTAQWLDCLDKTYGQLDQHEKALACWIVFNRIDSVAYPDSALEVLQQPGQFAEFSDDTAPTQGSLEIARQEYYYWTNDKPSLCGRDAVFISIDSNGVSVRNNFDVNKANIWRADYGLD